jgi:NADH dehydrogenase
VAEFGNKRFSGVIAWLLWSLVHVFLLIGFRSRVTVMRQWIWAYVTRAGASPLITEYQRPESQGNRAREETKISAGMGNA